MQEKPVDQLSFIKTPKAIPTVEIDIDSIPKTMRYNRRQVVGGNAGDNASMMGRISGMGFRLS